MASPPGGGFAGFGGYQFGGQTGQTDIARPDYFRRQGSVDFVKPTAIPVSNDFEEVLRQRFLRKDSEATLVDFGRRPSNVDTGPSKFQLNVIGEPQQGITPPLQNELKKGSPHEFNRRRSSLRPTKFNLNVIGEDDTGLDQFNPFAGEGKNSTKNQWRPGLSILPQNEPSRNNRQDSDATLVDWGRRRSSAGSFGRRRSSAGAGLAVADPIEETAEPLAKVDIGGIQVGVRPPSLELDQGEKSTDVIEAMERPLVMNADPFSDIQVAVMAPIVQAMPVVQSYPVIDDPVDPARKLGRVDLIQQRSVFTSGIFMVNAALLIVALAAPRAAAGAWVLSFICFIKSKDCLSALISCIYLSSMGVYHYFKPLAPVESKWILSLIPAYSESEEQIVKTVFSLRDNGVAPHKQVMAIVLDGKQRDVKKHMRITKTFTRPYVTSKFKRNDLVINAGFMEDVPVICFEKVNNAGKKDSLILCHDLFNEMRENAPLYTQLLRKELWEDVLPPLTGEDFPGFDMVFCTDADSTIHQGAIADLANALARDPKAIAACGLVLVELEPGYEWSVWNLYQQFQYNFGQFVRRQAEHVVGKVTCLPGCITMVAVRPEMAGAMRKYAEPITIKPVLHHQVQYLGTDRRLTYSMLSQDKKLHTLFVPSAVSETVAPQSFKHYLSQRRRWGSNAYFNNYFYAFGENMIPITRVWATIELTRLSLVYYRIANTAMFIYGLTREFSIMSLVPLIIVSQIPTVWFFVCIATNKQLRQRAHKILLGYCINKLISPFMSAIIFSTVVKNLGSQAWGMTGGTATTAPPPPAALIEIDEKGVDVASLSEKQALMSDRKASVCAESIGPGSTMVPSTYAPSTFGAASTYVPSNYVASQYVPSTYGRNRYGSTSIGAEENDLDTDEIGPLDEGGGRSEVNEIDEDERREKIVGLLAAGL